LVNWTDKQNNRTDKSIMKNNILASFAGNVTETENYPKMYHCEILRRIKSSKKLKKTFI